MDWNRNSIDNQFWFSSQNENEEVWDITTRLLVALTGTETGSWEWRFDPESVHWNEQTEELFGYDHGESPETHEAFIRRIHPDDRDAVVAEFERALAEGFYDTEFRVMVDERVTRWIRARAAVVTDEDGTLERLVGLATDVTTDKMREQELERFQTLVEHSPDGITHIRPDGTMTYVSGGERILGRPREEFIGEPLERFIHPADTQQALDFFEGLRSGDDPTPFEGRIKHADGTWMWIETTAISLDNSSNAEGFLTVTRSIAERKKYEQRLEAQRDNLETLNEVVRHDIRNDLQVVVGNADMLEDAVDESEKRHLDTIQESIANAVDLTQQARDLSEAMLQTEDEIETVRLSPILKAQLEEVRAAYPDTEITTEGTLPKIAVKANRLLEAVFRNILKNAIQHNDKPTPKVSVSVEHSNGTVQVRFADNGPGISDSMKDTAFDKAEHGLESAGSGIGLYLVQSLVERYDGDVWVEDNTPEGAVFLVRLIEAA